MGVSQPPGRASPLHGTAPTPAAPARPRSEPLALRRDPDALSKLDEPALDAFWGYDLVVEGGLLDRVYQQLGIPPTKWQGLKAMPMGALHEEDATRRLVRRSARSPARRIGCVARPRDTRPPLPPPHRDAA